jgi:hypothetical protein
MTGTATIRTEDTQEAAQQTEGVVARTIEKQTAKLPSDIFLWAALGAIGVAAYLEFFSTGQKMTLNCGHS